MTRSIDDTNAATGRILSRRGALTGLGGIGISAAAVALLGGRENLALAAGAEPTQEDITILNTALSAEHEAIAAYQLGAESGLLGQGAKSLALTFQGHHKEHADALAATVKKLGGTAGEAQARYDFATDGLKSEADVLRFAAGLEKGAVSAYLGAVPLFADRELARVAASILGDEAMHWAVLRSALGEAPVPVAFVS
ncbi:MAG: ferritin-like domain-containing protein [Proteobacteria bacterium]|nr:ferritin-like domain-containing protein [Pseudomonadota bacterium]